MVLLMTTPQRLLLDVINVMTRPSSSTMASPDIFRSVLTSLYARPLTQDNRKTDLSFGLQLLSVLMIITMRPNAELTRRMWPSTCLSLPDWDGSRSSVALYRSSTEVRRSSLDRMYSMCLL